MPHCEVSRRAIVGMLAAAPIPKTHAGSSDAELFALGRELASIPTRLESSNGHDEAIALLDRSEEISSAIATINSN